MPSTFTELSRALEKNLDFLSKHKMMQESFQLYSAGLKELSKRFHDISVEMGGRDFYQLVHFEDEHEENFGGPAYAFSVNHHAKRISLSFRGSVTTRDFFCDWKTSLCNIPNPLAGEPRIGDDFIRIHNGFKKYLYDPVVERENRDGIIEKQQLIFHLVTKVAELFEEYPDYRLYTTGHSLGGALATLFAMEAAASKDPRIPKPVTCITIASPRVGNLSFAKAFKVGSR